MTIKEAEKQYELEVQDCIERNKENIIKWIQIWCIIGSILTMLGIVLLIIGCAAPKEIDSFGNEWDSSTALLQKLFGLMSLICGIVFFIIGLLLRKSLKKGPKNFLPQIKNLYYNYLLCEDMTKDNKEFYKQKLEDIRNAELVSAMNDASRNASVAILFSMIKR